MMKKSKTPKLKGTSFDIDKPSNRRRIEDRTINRSDRSMEIYNHRTLDFERYFKSVFDTNLKPIVRELVIGPDYKGYWEEKDEEVERLVFEFEPSSKKDEYVVFLCGTSSQFQKFGNSKRKRIGFIPFYGIFFLNNYVTLTAYLQMYFRTKLGYNDFYSNNVQNQFRIFAKIKPFEFRAVDCPTEIISWMEDINDMADMASDIIKFDKLNTNKWTTEESDIVVCLCNSVMRNFTKITSRFLGI